MRVLVTGGAGFLGSHLVERLLDEGFHVDVVDDLSGGSLSNLSAARSDRTGRLTIHQVDVRDPGLVELVVRREPDVVFHLANHRGEHGSIDEAVLDAQINVAGALNVIEAARRAGVDKIVTTISGTDLYARPTAGDLPVREKHPHGASTPHAVARRAVLDYLELYRDLHALEFSVLVTAEVYGPRRRRGLVVELLTQARVGQIELDPRSSADLVHVDDVVDAMVRAVDKGGGLSLNIGTGVETTVADLVDTIVVAGRLEAPEWARPRPVERLALDPGRARIHLGWSAWTRPGDGVAAMLGPSDR